MAGEKQAEARARMERFEKMTLDDVAVEAAANPDSTYAQVVQIEMARRVAQAQIDAADAQRMATGPLKVTAWATIVLAIATLGLAAATYLFNEKPSANLRHNSHFFRQYFASMFASMALPHFRKGQDRTDSGNIRDGNHKCVN